MDYCFSYKTLQPLPSTGKAFTITTSLPRISVKDLPSNSSDNYRLGISLSGRYHRGPALVVRATTSSECGEYSGLNTPVQPKTPAGRFLSSVLLNDSENFPQVVHKQLEQLGVDRDEALARMNLTAASDEACLHRRIAELKEQECQVAVEDVMYMLICSKFYEVRVHLVPRLSQCMYNGRVEILPSKDWELESIHSFEVLEMIREHLTNVVSWRANSNVKDKWTVTQIPRLQLCRVYTASVLYGYFLKSASLRHTLEKNLFHINIDLSLNVDNHFPVSGMWNFGLKGGHLMSTRSTSLKEVSCIQGKKREKLGCYVMGFDPESFQMCAKPKSKEAAKLIERQTSALFGDEKTGLLETNEEISTSFASLKRFVLEAIAFGSFLWDAEEYVNSVYKLEDNSSWLRG